MVADRDRGQLLLVGAVLVAVVVVGIVVQLNSLEYSNDQGSLSHEAVVDRAADAEAAVVDDVTGITARVRAETSEAEFEDALRENISTYNNYTRNMSVTSGDASLNVSLNTSASSGFSVEQTSGGDFDDPSTDDNEWDFVNGTTRIETFWLNTTSIDGSNKFNLTVVGGDGNVWSLRLSDNPDPVLEVYDGTTGTTSTCALGAESVDINVLDGSVRGGVCGGFTSFEDVLTAPYNVTITKGQRASGSYRLEGVGDLQPPASSFDSHTERIIVPHLDFTYRSAELAYNRTIEIEGATP